jgi:hypothetical protein
MQRIEQSEKEFAWRSHLRHIERKWLAFDECLQQTRFAHTLRAEYQHGFSYLRLVPKAAQLLFALDTTQIFKRRLALGRR